MVRVTLRLPSLRRAFAVLLTAAALAATGFVWARVVSTLANGVPQASSLQATSVVWGDRVFLSPSDLTAWLHARGATYRGWSHNHPAAADRLERRTSRPEPASTGATASRAHAAAGKRPMPHESAVQQTPSSGGFPYERVLVTLLIVLAVAAVAAGSLPAVILYRFPRVTRTIGPRRDILFAGAGAILMAVVAAVVLS
jgi:hypothetical protein